MNHTKNRFILGHRGCFEPKLMETIINIKSTERKSLDWSTVLETRQLDLSIGVQQSNHFFLRQKLMEMIHRFFVRLLVMEHVWEYSAAIGEKVDGRHRTSQKYLWLLPSTLSTHTTMQGRTPFSSTCRPVEKTSLALLLSYTIAFYTLVRKETTVQYILS